MIFMRTQVSPELPQVLVQESLTNYVLILAALGLSLIVAGIAFASLKTNKMRKQIRSYNDISELLKTDIVSNDPGTGQFHDGMNKKLSDRDHPGNDESSRMNRSN
jgi:hypothetical protein